MQREKPTKKTANAMKAVGQKVKPVQRGARVQQRFYEHTLPTNAGYWIAHPNRRFI
jgi:hypothetical protein